MTFLVLRSFYEERNPEDLELHGMESQPGMARYGNSQSNFAHKMVRVCYIQIHLKESFHSIHENWFPWILIKPQYSTEFPFNYFKTTMLYRDYLSFCHLDEKRYSVTRGTDQGQEGYVSMATLLNSQSEVSSWSSQEVNVSQPQGQCEICQGQ